MKKHIHKLIILVFVAFGGILALSLSTTTHTVEADDIKDGDLIKIEKGEDMYLVKEEGGKKYRRYMPEEFLKYYEELDGENIKIANEEDFEEIRYTQLVQEKGGGDVYRVERRGDHLKRRAVKLDIDNGDFEAAGYTLEEVFKINEQEYNNDKYVNGDAIVNEPIDLVLGAEEEDGVGGAGAQSSHPQNLVVWAGYRKEQISEVMYNRGWSISEMEAFNETHHAALLGADFYPEDGVYLPGVYHNISPTISQEDLGKMMVQRFADNFHWGIHHQVDWIDTWQQLVSAASLVQREAGSSADTRIIAGVMAYRMYLNPNNVLQLNPSVIYIRGKTDDRDWWQGPMPDPHSDEYKDHPVNTFTQGGVPSHPIANPSLATINDTVNYAKHDYYFFLHALGSPNKINGANPIFCSRTNNQHNKYRAWFLRLHGDDPVHIVGSNCVVGNHSLIRRSGRNEVYHVVDKGGDKFKRRIEGGVEGSIFKNDYDYFSEDEVQVVSQSKFDEYQASRYVVEYDQKGRNQLSSPVWELRRVNGALTKKRVASSINNFNGNPNSIFPATTKELNRYHETPPNSTMYRAYNTRTGTHFYTTNRSEYENLGRIWNREGAIGGILSAPWVESTNVVYRTYNPRTGAHFYTISESEYHNAINRFGFQGEGGIGRLYRSSGGGSRPALYRTYNPRTGAHFYTTSHSEAMNAVNRYGFHYEGRMGYMNK